jgi:DNA-binding GntR family transcriptional regulator
MCVTGIDAGAATRTEEVYQVLRTDLLNGRIAPGQRLKLVELSTRFELSQSVIREALARLAAKGLVVATPQRGYRVRDLSVHDIRALTEARVQIESVTLRFAIERGDIHWETGVLASHHLLENTPVTAERGELNEDWSARHQAFHRALLSGSANPHLEAAAAELRDCGELYRRWYWTLTDDGDRDLATEHRLLKELTLARETDAALALLRTHIERAPLKLIAYAAEHCTDGILNPPSDASKGFDRSTQAGPV